MVRGGISGSLEMRREKQSKRMQNRSHVAIATQRNVMVYVSVCVFAFEPRELMAMACTLDNVTVIGFI